jgi:hypothetical protein
LSDTDASLCPRSSGEAASRLSAEVGQSGGLDATEELACMRNSPLDELAERMSRMRSVGRS